MNRFAKPLSRVFQFGKILQRGTERFGRGLSTIANKVSGGLGNAERVVGIAEKYLGRVPVIGSGVKAIGDVLGAASGGAQIVGAAGSGLSALSRGDRSGVHSAVMQGRLGAQKLSSEGASLGGNVAKTAAQAAVFL